MLFLLLLLWNFVFTSLKWEHITAAKKMSAKENEEFEKIGLDLDILCWKGFISWIVMEDGCQSCTLRFCDCAHIWFTLQCFVSCVSVHCSRSQWSPWFFLNDVAIFSQKPLHCNFQTSPVSNGSRSMKCSHSWTFSKTVTLGIVWRQNL